MAAIITAIFFVVDKLLNNTVVRWIVFKALLLTLFLIVLPLVLKGVIVWLFGVISSMVLETFSTSGLQPFIMNTDGLLSWFVIHMRMADLLSMLMSALSLRFTLRIIRIL